MSRKKKMVGLRFGVVEVLCEDGYIQAGSVKKIAFKCRCTICGNVIRSAGEKIRRGVKQCSKKCWTKSRRQAVSLQRTTHGMSGSNLYKNWVSLVCRCTNPNDKSYHHYGGRGIKVHPDWVGPGGFERFAAHIGPKPSAKHSIDRINNNGNYEPGNVRWATRSQQRRNTRFSRFLSFDGNVLHINEVAEIAGVKKKTLHARIIRKGLAQRCLDARLILTSKELAALSSK